MKTLTSILIPISIIFSTFSLFALDFTLEYSPSFSGLELFFVILLVLDLYFTFLFLFSCIKREKRAILYYFFSGLLPLLFSSTPLLVHVSLIKGPNLENYLFATYPLFILTYFRIFHYFQAPHSKALSSFSYSLFFKFSLGFFVCSFIPNTLFAISLFNPQYIQHWKIVSIPAIANPIFMFPFLGAIPILTSACRQYYKTVVIPTQAMLTAFKSKTHFLTIDIPYDQQDNEIYQLANQINNKWLPIKHKALQTSQETPPLLKPDDILKPL